MTSVAGNRPLAGLALLRKPAGITSFQALTSVKRAAGTRKVGHAGTLDRFAQGLLVVLSGSYSRLVPYIAAGKKLYRGTIAFGTETDTLDPEGSVVAAAPAPSVQLLEEALPAFRGSILQRPPAYSAIHVQGKRAYQLALSGNAPILEERRVTVYSLELLSYDDSNAFVEIGCSGGTYIRSLARDIALACGSRAYLRALERVAIGPFRVENAVAPEEFAGADLRALSGDEASALGLRTVCVTPAAQTRFCNGGRVHPEEFSAIDGGPSAVGSEAAVFSSGGTLLGIIRLEADGPTYKVVLPESENNGEAAEAIC